MPIIGTFVGAGSYQTSLGATIEAASLTVPAPFEFLREDVEYTISGTCASDSSIEIYDGATKLGDATVSGGSFTFDYTWANTDYDIQLKAVGNKSGDSATVPVVVSLADAATELPLIDTTVRITTGHPDPDGGNNAYLTEWKSAATFRVYPADFTIVYDGASGFAFGIWLARKDNGKVGALQLYGTNNVEATGGTVDLDNHTVQAEDTFAYLAETRTSSDGRLWGRYVFSAEQNVTGNVVWRMNMQARHSVEDGLSTSWTTDDGFYTYDLESASGPLPFTAAERISVADYGSNGAGDYYQVRSEYQDSLVEFYGAPSSPNRGDMNVLMPHGVSDGGGTMPLVFGPNALSNYGNLAGTPVHDAFALYNVPDRYNIACAGYYSKQGFNSWYGTDSAGNKKYDIMVRDQIIPWICRKYNLSTDREKLLAANWSKGGWSIVSMMLLHELFGYGLSFDGNFSDVYGDNSSDTFFGSEAAYQNHNPLDIVAANAASLSDKKRVIMINGSAFPTDSDAMAAAFDTNGISYDLYDQPTWPHDLYGTMRYIPELMTLAGIPEVAGAAKMVMGFDFATTTGHMSFTAGSPVLVDGMKDISGSGNNAFATGTSRPTTNVTTVGSLPSSNNVIDFDGGDYLQINDFAYNTNNFSIVIGAQFDAAGSEEYLISHYDTGSNQRSWGLYKSAANALAIIMSENGTSTSVVATTSAFTATNYNIFEIEFDGDNDQVQMYINGALQAVSGTVPTMNLHDSTANILIGARLISGTPSTHFTGSIGELFMYDNVLTATGRRNIEKATARRRGVALT